MALSRWVCARVCPCARSAVCRIEPCVCVAWHSACFCQGHLTGAPLVARAFPLLRGNAAMRNPQRAWEWVQPSPTLIAKCTGECALGLSVRVLCVKVYILPSPGRTRRGAYLKSLYGWMIQYPAVCTRSCSFSTAFWLPNIRKENLLTPGCIMAPNCLCINPCCLDAPSKSSKPTMASSRSPLKPTELLCSFMFWLPVLFFCIESCLWKTLFPSAFSSLLENELDLSSMARWLL